MEHKNEVIQKVLRNHFSDYDKNQWHYNEEYKICDEVLKATEKLNVATVSERNLLFGFIEFSNHLETERSQIPKSRANIYLAHKNK